MERSRTTDHTPRKPFSPSATSKFVENAARAHILVKDHNYFRDKTWNNSYLASGKIYSFYHQKENQLLQRQADLKEQMRWQQFDARQALFEQRAVANREAALASLQNVACARMGVQKEASQPVLDRHYEGILRLSRGSDAPAQASRPCHTSPARPARASQNLEELFSAKSSTQMLRLMNQKPSLLWNKVTKLNAKNLDLLMTPEVLRRDRKAFVHIKNRQKAELEERQLLEKRKKFMHDFIRWKGKARPLHSYPGAEPGHQDRLHQFMNHDDPALNGLFMNDVLRVKGVVANTAVQKILKANSFLRTMKLQERPASPRKTIRCSAPQRGSQSPLKESDLYCKVDEFDCDFESFEEALGKLKKFREGRYPRINLERAERGESGHGGTYKCEY